MYQSVSNYLELFDDELSLLLAQTPSDGEGYPDSYHEYPDLFKKLIKSDTEIRRRVGKVFRIYSKRSLEFVDFKDVTIKGDETVSFAERIWQDFSEELSVALLFGLGLAMVAGGQHSEREVRIDTGWSDTNEVVLNYLNRHTFNLVKGLNRTTRNRMRSAIKISVKTNETLDQLENRLTKIVDDKNRARIIGHTESVRAYNVGRVEAVKEMNVKSQKIWDSIIDKRTSSICIDLDGKTIPVDKKFETITGEKVEGPPAHVNCRSGLRFDVRKK